MKLLFHTDAWDDYQYWAQTDKKILKRINLLIKDIQRSPFAGIGKPEALRENLAGFWSRRIDDYHRLVYRIEDDQLIITHLRGHYDR
jgi:toxin YoeB